MSITHTQTHTLITHGSLVRCRASPYVTALSVYKGAAQSAMNWMASTDTGKTLVNGKVVCVWETNPHTLSV